MAIGNIGTARVIVRAITRPIKKDIQRGFAGANSTVKKAGNNLGRTFSEGFQKGHGNIFKKLINGIRSLGQEYDKARRAFSDLNRTAQWMTTIISTLIGGVSALIGAIGALGGNALGAASSVLVLGNALFSIAAGAIAAKLALGGVGKAVSMLNNPKGGGGGGGSAAMLQAIEAAERSLSRTIERNRERLLNANNTLRKAQLALNKAIKEGREEIQQLGFDSEDAALAEQRAALELEKARISLARAQDLPPNSRVRQEAELAYQESELNYRKAKDRAADLGKEQDRLARTGVAGTRSVMAATDALARAEAAKSKAIRDGLRDQTDAEMALKDAKNKKSGGGGGGGQNPYEGLNAAQIKFADFISGLKPQFDALSEIAANSFLPRLQEAIETLMDKAYPVVAKGIGLMGAAMGDAAIALANAITTTRNLANLDKLFVTSAPLLVTIGEILGKVWGIMLSLLNAVAPMAQRYFDFLLDRLTRFDNWMKSIKGNNSMSEFFGKAEVAAAQWGRIIDNIFGGFGGMITANLGPGTGGQYLLDWLERATGKWDGLNDTTEGAAELKANYQTMAVNAQKMLSSIGALLDEFITLGQNKSIGKTFDILAEGAPNLGNILDKFADAGPNMAEVIVTLTEILDLFLDSATAQAFFDTLNLGFTAIKNFMEQPWVQKIVEFAAPIAGVALALGAITKAAMFGKLVVGGYLGMLVDGAKKALALAGGLKKAALASWGFLKSLVANAKQMVINTALWVKDAAKTVASTVAKGAAAAINGVVTAAQWLWNIAVSANPIGLIILAIVALVAAIVLLITNWDNVVKFVTDIWDGFVGWFMGIMDGLLEWWDGVWSGFMGFITDTIDNIISWVQDNWGLLLSLIIGPIGLIIQWVVEHWGEILEFFEEVWNNVVTFFTDALAGFVGFWVDSWNNVLKLVTDVWNNVLKFFTDIWNNIKKFFWDALIAYVTFWKDTWDGISDTVSDIWNGILGFFKDVWNNIKKFFEDALSNFTKGWDIVWNRISDTVSDIWTNIETFLSDAFGTVEDLWNGFWEGLSSTVSDIWTNIEGFVKDAWNNIIGFIEGGVNGAIGLINGLTSGVNDATAGARSVVPAIPRIPKFTIPRLADGATVFPSRGGSIVNVAEAGKPERIEPLDEDGLSKRDRALITFLAGGDGGGTTINVYGAPGQNVQELAQEVSRIISFRMRKGSA